MAHAPFEFRSPVGRMARLRSATTRRFGRFMCAAGMLTAAACSDRPSPVAPIAQPPSDASALRVPVTGSYMDLSVRGDVTCAIRNHSVVECWGNNLLGAAPASKMSSTGGNFGRVSTSGFHTCATRSDDGAVECWGKNEFGEAPPVVPPPSGKSFGVLTTADGYTCTLRSDAAVQCWGLNDVGQAPPEWFGTSGSFTAVSAGGSRTCGLTTAGIIECVGQTPFTFAPTTGTFTRVLSSLAGTCGLRSDGVVQCRDPLPSNWVFPTGTFTDYDATHASGGHTCGVREDGTIACFGDNSEGQAPATRTSSTGNSYLRVETGWKHSCALTGGRIECWGNPAAAAVTVVLPTATFTAPTSVIVGQNIMLAMSDAQVPGYPSATAFTYAFDCGSGFGAASATATASCLTSTTGTRTVKGRVIDQDLDGTTYSTTVLVKSAAQGTTDLSAEISSAPLAPDIRKALMTKLNAALKAIADGKKNAACSALNDFINQVNAQRGKAIPTATADAWIDTARQLRAALGC